MINVIGLGYIGLPTALMLASHGLPVTGTDCSEALIAALQNGAPSFPEPGLNGLFSEAAEHSIRFTTEYVCADTYILCVPTPYDRDTRKVDPRYILSALDGILKACPPGALIILESTVSPGTVDRYIRPALRAHGFTDGQDLHLAHAPERILPGNMLQELVYNDRTVGADDPAIAQRVRELYGSFCRGQILLTDIRTAEMTKVVENTYRAVNIAFANELAKLCSSEGLDVYEIIRICNRHPRVNILQPGPGVGGHCISVDPWFLVGDHPELAGVIDASMKVNERMPMFVLARIRQIMAENGISDPARVGLYGLAYKEDVDDCRESPTLQLLRQQDLGYPLKVYDPMVRADLVKNQFHDLDDFLAGIDLVVIMTGHRQVRDDPRKLIGKRILDTRNVISLPGVYRL